MKPIEEQIKEVYVKIVWTHKIQEKSADINLNNHRYIKLVQVVVSALTTGSLIIAVFGKSRTGTILGAIFSALGLGLQAYTKDIDFGQKSNQHAKTADALRSIREDYLSLLVDMRSMYMNHSQIVERRDQLKIRYDEILATAPRTGSLAFKRASKALNTQEDHTFSKEELNRFLPFSLRDIVERTVPSTDSNNSKVVDRFIEFINIERVAIYLTLLFILLGVSFLIWREVQ